MPIVGNRYPFTEDYVAIAPAQAGVYAIYNQGGVIYYGHALGGLVTIRSRLEDHISGREGVCTRWAYEFRYEECADPPAREQELLEEYRREHGTVPRCNAPER
jgi:hypothetical protein